VKLLALETATELCSVALRVDGETRWRAARTERGHGEHVLRMIDELLAEGGMSLRQCAAIAFGVGPGAFTGVRLGASIAQGLAYASGLPVLPVSTLRASAQQALWPSVEPVAPRAVERALVCQDARMGEVYWALFRRERGVAVAEGVEMLGPPAAVLARLHEIGPERSLCGAGSGYAVHQALAEALVARRAAVLPELAPHAREIALLAAHAGLEAAVPPAEAQPVYLRNNVAAIPAARPAGAR
jgi:tRNA threonylcarbamoyladenosine biosynthesis protein TsaB